MTHLVTNVLACKLEFPAAKESDLVYLDFERLLLIMKVTYQTTNSELIFFKLRPRRDSNDLNFTRIVLTSQEEKETSVVGMNDNVVGVFSLTPSPDSFVFSRYFFNASY